MSTEIAEGTVQTAPVIIPITELEADLNPGISKSELQRSARYEKPARDRGAKSRTAIPEQSTPLVEQTADAGNGHETPAKPKSFSQRHPGWAKAGRIGWGILKGLSDAIGVTDIVTGAKDIYCGIRDGNSEQAWKGLYHLAKGALILGLTFAGYGQFVGAGFQLLEGNFTGALLSIGIGVLAVGGAVLVKQLLNRNTLALAKSGIETITKEAAVEVAEEVGANALKVAPKIMAEAGKEAAQAVVAGVEQGLKDGAVKATTEAVA